MASFISAFANADKAEDKVAIPPSIMPGLPAARDLKPYVEGRYPQFYVGSEHLDGTLLREVYALKDGSQMGVAVLPIKRLSEKQFPELGLRLQNWIKEGLISSKDGKTLTNQLKAIELTEAFTFQNYVGMSVWMTRMLQVPSQEGEEADLFRQTNYYADYEALAKQPDAIERRIGLDWIKAAIDREPKRTEPMDGPRIKHGTYPVLSFFDKYDEHVPRDVPCLLPGVGKFGLGTAIQAMLSGQYLIALPNRSLAAHATQLSPLGFALHDEIHHKVDPRDNIHAESTYDLMDSLYRKVDPMNQKALEESVFSHAIESKGMINRIFFTLYQDIFRKVGPSLGEKALRRQIVAWFLMMHESYDYPKNLYQTKDLLSLFDQIEGCYRDDNAKLRQDLKEGKWNDGNGEDVLSPDDPFMTDPLDADGASKLGDVAIVDWVMKNKLKQRVIYDSEVKRSALLISVELNTQGKGISISDFPTLHGKLKNAEDIRRLLLLAGIKVKKPDFTKLAGPENWAHRRTLAQRYLLELQHARNELMIEFAQINKALLSISRTQEGESLADLYFKWSFNREDHLNRRFNTQHFGPDWMRFDTRLVVSNQDEGAHFGDQAEATNAQASQAFVPVFSGWLEFNQNKLQELIRLREVNARTIEAKIELLRDNLSDEAFMKGFELRSQLADEMHLLGLLKIMSDAQANLS